MLLQKFILPLVPFLFLFVVINLPYPKLCGMPGILMYFHFPFNEFMLFMKKQLKELILSIKIKKDVIYLIKKPLKALKKNVTSSFTQDLSKLR